MGAAEEAFLRAAVLALRAATLRSWKAAVLTFRFSSRRSTTSLYDHPTSCERRCAKGTERISFSCWGGSSSKIDLDGAVLASGLEAEDAESLGDNHLLLAVVRRGNTLEDLQALESGGATGGLCIGNV